MDKVTRELRKTILKLAHICQDGNLQSAFSCVDALWVLYDKIMNWSPATAKNYDRDICIISKGQATLALYAVLIAKGMFAMEDMVDMGTFDSRYCIQADPTKFPDGGIENAAGSLGHGLPFAAGIAHANKIVGSPSRVFALTGDGEFCEGTMWEACLFAASQHLDNLCIIVDDNASAGAMVDMGSLRTKLESFGLDVDEVDGHDMGQLESAFFKCPAPGRPQAVITHTVRGYGSTTLTDHDIWFHKAPNDEELTMLLAEVDSFRPRHGNWMGVGH